jgi:hypothetical protein
VSSRASVFHQHTHNQRTSLLTHCKKQTSMRSCLGRCAAAASTRATTRTSQQTHSAAHRRTCHTGHKQQHRRHLRSINTSHQFVVTRRRTQTSRGTRHTPQRARIAAASTQKMHRVLRVRRCGEVNVGTARRESLSHARTRTHPSSMNVRMALYLRSCAAKCRGDAKCAITATAHVMALVPRCAVNAARQTYQAYCR